MRMMKIVPIPCLLVSVCMLFQLAARADQTREESIAEVLAQRLPGEELVEIREPDREFLGLLREHATMHERGAIILVHGMGQHPDWPQVIAPLRRALPDAGWTTLSVQMPILAPEVPIADYGTTLVEAGNRLGASIQHLRDRHYQRIVIVGYGFGAATAAWYVARDPGRRSAALVSISMLAQRYLNPRLKVLDFLKEIDIPLLDIYGNRDYDEVLAGARQRRLAGRQNGNDAYRQIRIDGADHSFTGREADLAQLIVDWLDQALPGPREADRTEVWGQ